jgi:hypothetical protein
MPSENMKKGRFLKILKNRPVCSALSSATENTPYAELGIRVIARIKNAKLYGFAVGRDFFEARFCARAMIFASSTPRADVIRSSVSKLGLCTSCST